MPEYFYDDKVNEGTITKAQWKKIAKWFFKNTFNHIRCICSIPYSRKEPKYLPKKDKK